MRLFRDMKNRNIITLYLALPILSFALLYNLFTTCLVYPYFFATFAKQMINATTNVFLISMQLKTSN